ncbi:hypothetical protein [Streptomyces sp. RP5T]|uniref:hypothetical protein n=1 Tax=Streptomyces sp. RP5T TaxID=2490848 RepID=UPI000F654D35|nr:hypothetical protein [Streptomyces sp. RP5T]RRR85697.1 hypothetical protein EHS43_07175 [Streptomyces sp. RP5T]
MTDTEVTLSTIGRMAGVGRACVANWRRTHDDFPEPVGGTATSPTFRYAAAKNWLRAHDKLPYEPPAPREPATLVFDGGQTITVYAPDLRVPSPGNRYDRYEEFGGYIVADDRDGIPWPRATVRIDVPGQTPYTVTDANVDISYATRSMQYLSMIWSPERRQLAAPTPASARTQPKEER